jgi:hypothetical protein
MGQPKRQSNASHLDLNHEAPPGRIENRGNTWSRRSSGSQNELSRSSVAGRSQA